MGGFSNDLYIILEGDIHILIISTISQTVPEFVDGWRVLDLGGFGFRALKPLALNP